MNILVVGCGKVGSSLAVELDRRGHDVAVVDRSPDSFNLLSNDFTGFTVTGVPIDLDVLRSAGVEGCDAVAAVSSDDNVNIMVSQLAMEIFHVKNVIARVTDTKREDVFSHFGLKTICPTNLTVGALCNALVDQSDSQSITYDASTVLFSRILIPKEYVGKAIREIASTGSDETLFAIQRHPYGMMLAQESQEMILMEGDTLIFCRVAD